LDEEGILLLLVLEPFGQNPIPNHDDTHQAPESGSAEYVVIRMAYKIVYLTHSISLALCM
jgi:hypothetical protein